MKTRLSNFLVALCMVTLNAVAADKQIFQFGKASSIEEVETKTNNVMIVVPTNGTPVNIDLKDFRRWMTNGLATSNMVFTASNTLASVDSTSSNALRSLTLSSSNSLNALTLTTSNALQASIDAGGGGGTVQTNISYVAVTNLTSFGAVTNGQTGSVTIAGLTLFDQVISAQEFVGGGSGLSALSGTAIASGTVADARISSTITRDSELVAADTVVSNGLVTGLAAGSYAIIATNSIFVNATNYVGTNRVPYWTVELDGVYPQAYLRDNNGVAFARVRESAEPNRAIYLGDVSDNQTIDAVSLRVLGVGAGNQDPRITFVFGGTATNSSGVEIASDSSWQFHESNFGPDWLDTDFNHVPVAAIAHNYTNTLYFGQTNWTTTLRGSNVVSSTNMTVQGTFNPSGGIIGNRTITTNASPQLGTLYTNGARRGWFTTSVQLEPAFTDAGVRIITFTQGGTATNRWAEVWQTDNGGDGEAQRIQMTAPLNPNEVWYLSDFSAGGTVTIITNTWKIVNE